MVPLVEIYMPEIRKSNALTMGLRLPCTNPLIWSRKLCITWNTTDLILLIQSVLSYNSEHIFVYPTMSLFLCMHWPFVHWSIVFIFLWEFLLIRLLRGPVMSNASFNVCIYWICLLVFYCIALYIVGPFYYHGLILIPAWISNHLPSKMYGEITYPFPNFNGGTVEISNG